MNASRVYQSSRILNEAEIIAKEPNFYQDLNDDGQVSSTVVNTTSSDSLLGNTNLVGGEAGTFMTASGQDQLVFSNLFTSLYRQQPDRR